MFLASPSPCVFDAQPAPVFFSALQPVRDLNARYPCSAAANTSSSQMLPGSEKCSSNSNNNTKATVLRRGQSKYNSLFRGKDEERSRRRGAFFSKVKEAGEEKRYEARGEQHLRMSFLSSQKAWEQEQARLAEQWLASPEDEEERLPVEDNTAYTNEEDLVEEFEAVEDEAMEAIFASAAQAEQAIVYEQDMSDYGSEDEDYDRLLLEMAMQTEKPRDGELVASSANEDDHVMDESTL